MFVEGVQGAQPLVGPQPIVGIQPCVKVDSFDMSVHQADVTLIVMCTGSA